VLTTTGVVDGQAVLAAGSQLLSDDHSTSWQDLAVDDQQRTASRLVAAVETSSFLRADLSRSPQTLVIDYSNIST